MTDLMYIKYPDLFESTAQIINHGVDSKGMYLVLNQTLFYPQGGGQPADQGIITTNKATYKVFDVRKIDGEVRHYIKDDGQNSHPHHDLVMQIDKARRMLNSKYHTAGHLIAAVAEKIFSELRAIKGHQFPGEAYIEFDGIINNSDNFLAQLVVAVEDIIISHAIVKTKELSQQDIDMIVQDLPYALPKEKTLRVCHIAGFSPVPCGGTHVQTLEDIALLSIKKCTSKKGKTKIYYEV